MRALSVRKNNDSSGPSAGITTSVHPPAIQAKSRAKRDLPKPGGTAFGVENPRRSGPNFGQIPIFPERIKSNGCPIPMALQAKMEAAFKTDFSDVRIHQGPEASSLAARAFTQGRDIYFERGEYNPDSRQGQQLLGHELAHVVQQKRGWVGINSLTSAVAVNSSPDLEREADALGVQAAHEDWRSGNQAKAVLDGLDMARTATGDGSFRSQEPTAGGIVIQRNGYEREDEFRAATGGHFPAEFRKADGSRASAVSKEEGLRGGWEVYNRARRGRDPAFFERKDHKDTLFPTGRPVDLEYRRNAEQQGSLFKPPRRPGGRGQRMWSPQINDAWVLGHIHGGRNAQLLSPATPTNLWDYEANRPTATGRESLQVLNAGYTPSREDPTPTATNSVFFSAPGEIPDARIDDVDRTRKWSQFGQLTGLGRFASRQEHLDSIRERYEAINAFDQTPAEETAALLDRMKQRQEEQERVVITD